MESLIRGALNRHLAFNIIAAAIVVLAFYIGQDIPRSFLPSIEMPRLTITATLPGSSARDMETKVTIPIEEAIDTVDGVDDYATTISDSVSVTQVDLYLDSSDEQVATAIQDLRDAIDGITDFPAEMEDRPIFSQFNPGKQAIVELALAGPMATLVPLAKDLEFRLEQLPTISRATVVGLQDPEVRVLVDPDRANTLGVTILDVVQAVQRRNVSSTGAVLEAAADRKQVTLWSRYEDPIEVADTIIRADPGLGVVRVRDIGRVEAGREDTGLLTHTNGQTGLSIVVRKRENADELDAIDQVRALVDASTLPTGVTLDYVNDITFYTRNRLEVMLTNGLIGSLLVGLVLFAFMRRDAAVWVLVGIPIVFCGAVATLPAFDMTINMFTLNGFVIVLGMVVDDAVVVAENIVSHRERGLTPLEAAAKGTAEMVQPVVAAALTTALAFGPIIAMGGLPGRVMWQIPAAVCLVLLFSLLESFFILPAHMASSKKAVSERRPFVTRLEQVYRKALNFCFRQKTIVLLSAFVVLIVILGVIRPLVPVVQFPQDDARLLNVQVTTPLGTSLEQTEAIATNLQRQIRQITAADFKTITARIGHQDVNGGEKSRGEAENEALLSIVFRDLNRERTNVEWIEVLNQELVPPAGVSLTMQSEIVGPPTGRGVTVHVRANDNEQRRAIAYEVLAFVEASDGINQIDVDERTGTPKLNLNPDYDKLALLGLDPQDVALTVQASFFGIEASEHRDMEDTTELRVLFDPAARGNLEAFLDTPLRARDGNLVRLRDVVNPVTTPGLDRIYHRDGFRTATVTAGFTPDSPYTALSYATVLEQQLLPRYADMPGVQVYIGGEAADTEETTGALGSVALLVVIAIAVVIWILLGSLVEALFVVIVIPFALAGVILAFFLHGAQLSMVAAVGTIGLAGVVVNASIVMLDAIHRRLAEEGNSRAQLEIITDAVVSRLRPILVTTLTTLGGVLPTAYGIGGYDMLVSPMSLAIGWGLAFSTGVTLFVVPVLFMVAQDINRRFKRGSFVQAPA